jgi:hypothetical protein
MLASSSWFIFPRTSSKLQASIYSSLFASHSTSLRAAWFWLACLQGYEASGSGSRTHTACCTKHGRENANLILEMEEAPASSMKYLSYCSGGGQHYEVPFSKFIGSCIDDQSSLVRWLKERERRSLTGVNTSGNHQILFDGRDLTHWGRIFLTQSRVGEPLAFLSCPLSNRRTLNLFGLNHGVDERLLSQQQTLGSHHR